MCRVPSGQGKPGRVAVFRKSQGKPGKVREFFKNFLKVREKSGNFFPEYLEFDGFRPILESPFSKFFLSDPSMVGPPNNHDLTTKITAIDYCETGRGAFVQCDNVFSIT